MTKRSLKEMMGGMIGPMTAIAQAMSRNYDVAIQPSGFECCTDGKVIKFPFNADYLQEADRQVLHGILDHEVAHVAEERDHAEAGIERPMAVMRRQRSKRHAMFLNVFEDIRIESKKSAQYPGVAENLAAANKHSVELFEKRHGSDMSKANFWHTIGSAIILKARGEDISWLPAGFRPYLDKVEDLIAQSNYPQTKWVQDSEKLAHEAIRRIEELAEEMEEEQEQREEQKQEQGEAGEGEDSEQGEQGEDEADDTAPSAGSEGEDEGEDDAETGTESNDGDEDERGEGGPKAESKQDESGDEEASEGETGKPGDMTDEELKEACEAAKKALTEDCDVSDALEEAKAQITEDARSEAKSSGRYVPDPAALKADRETRPAGNLDDYNKTLETVRKQVSALRSKLLAVIRTRSASRIVVDQEEGDLDDGALYSARMGNRRVFTEEVKGQKLDTAVSILVDLSGSMGCGDYRGHKAWYAKHMVVALSETFNALGVPFEVIGFHNDGMAAGASRSGGYSRIERFEYRVFKAFNEQFRRCRARFSTITGGGNNADSEAVMYIAKRLAVRREARKILFVVSDGMPAHGGDYMASRRHLKEVIKLVSGAGIEVLGIGAQCPEIRDYYNKRNGADHAIISDLDSLAVEVFKMMRARLLNSRKGAA